MSSPEICEVPTEEQIRETSTSALLVWLALAARRAAQIAEHGGPEGIAESVKAQYWVQVRIGQMTEEAMNQHIAEAVEETKLSLEKANLLMNRCSSELDRRIPAALMAKRTVQP